MRTWKTTPPSALALGPRVQERHRRVRFGVKDPVHVIGPANHPQHGDGLVRGDDELHPLARSVDTNRSPNTGSNAPPSAKTE